MIFIFAVHGSHAEELQAPESMHVKIKGEKELLVAKDIGGGLPFSHTFYLKGWCGNTSLLIHGTETGIELLDFNGNKTTVSSKGTDYPLGCTPDGKWVIYKDRNSDREYRDRFGRLPENIVDDGPGWHGFVTDLYRYEVASGRRQKFAVVRDDSTAIVSPDGLKVFLGNRHDSAIEMPEPKWEPVWLTNDWTYFDTFWLPDSSGIVTGVWGDGASLGVEFFGKDGWAKEFSMDMLRSAPESNTSIAAVDENNGLHFVTVENVSTDDSSRKTYNFFNCKIKHKDLICSLADGIKEDEDDNILSLRLLSNGDIIFKKEEDNCIRRVKHRKLLAECIADTRYNNEIYIGIDLIEISPDGKWMTFRRGKLPPPGKRFYAYQYDLFVKELSGD